MPQGNFLAMGWARITEMILVIFLGDPKKLNADRNFFAMFPLIIIILRIVVTGCFWREILYLVIFVRDNPLFDRLTFTIFIFKDINNERVFRMYPNLLISWEHNISLIYKIFQKSRAEVEEQSQ